MKVETKNEVKDEYDFEWTNSFGDGRDYFSRVLRPLMEKGQEIYLYDWLKDKCLLQRFPKCPVEYCGSHMLWTKARVRDKYKWKCAHEGYVWKIHHGRENTVIGLSEATSCRCPFSSDFVSCVLSWCSSFAGLGLSDAEVGLFCASTLLCPERQGLTSHKHIQHAHDRILAALKLQLSRRNSGDLGIAIAGDSPPLLFSSVLSKLPELRSLGAKHSLHLEWFRLNWARLHLPPLFAEIFDIPKCEEDGQ